MKSVTLELGKLRRRFLYRPNTSDEQVLQQVFGAEQFCLRRLARYQELLGFLQGIKRAGHCPLIVDAGANIGASSVYLALAFSTARIVALEPEPNNFAILSENVRGLNVHCVRAAVSAHPGQTRVADPGLGHWGYRTDPWACGPEVPKITIPQILADYGSPSCDPFLVKVDIEGGEKDLFGANTAWVERIPLLLVELHDWLLPRQGTALPFLRCISALDRDFVYIGETVFSIDNRLRPAS
jgi:FkbM family methyltransferase